MHQHACFVSEYYMPACLICIKGRMVSVRQVVLMHESSMTIAELVLKHRQTYLACQGQLLDVKTLNSHTQIVLTCRGHRRCVHCCS